MINFVHSLTYGRAKGFGLILKGSSNMKIDS